jgi:flagellar basal-body rod modification protein FlgD
MSISSITGIPPSTVANSATTGPIRQPKQTLGQEDFLKILSVQFQQQDPLKPTDDTAFIAQLAQFTSLEQVSQLRKDQQLLTANAYLGRNVTVQDADGRPLTGLVSAIDSSGKDLALVIGDQSYPLSSVKRIEPATPSPTQQTPAA